MMEWIQALYLWLAVVVIGLLAAFLASFLLNERYAAVVGPAAVALTVIPAAFVAGFQGEWWMALSAILGAATAWWQLFKKTTTGLRQSR